MSKKYVLLFFLLSIPLFTFAQGEEQKSINILLEKLKVDKNDSDKTDLLDSIAYLYKDINPDEGIKYARQELDLAVKLKWKVNIGNANANLGMNYEYKSDYPEALEYFFVALSMSEKIGNRYNTACTSNSIGDIYQKEGNYPKALEYFFKALKIDLDMHNTLNLGGDLGNIGIVYMAQGNFPKALEYDLQSLDTFRKIGNSGGVAHNLGNIGNIYKEQGEYSKALDYDIQAVNIFEKEGDKGSLALNLGNIGGIYLAIASDTIRHIRYSDFKLNGKVACLKKAIGYQEKSIAISKEISQMDNVVEFSLGLSKAYSMLGDYKNALESYKTYAAAKDSVFSSDDKDRIAKLGMQRELEVKNKQLEIDKLTISRKRNLDELYLVCIALVLLILGIVLKKVYPKLF